jgi:hypothetical protein
MTLRVSRSLLEAALLNMMNEAEPDETEAAPPAAPPPASRPAQAPPPEDKSGRAAFEAKLKELESVPDGKTYAVGNDTFVKKSGNWYLGQVEGVQGFDDKGLLTLVNDSAKEDIAAKIEKDKKSGYNLGVTIRGDQFIGGGADKSATFNRDNTGLYKDLTFIPAEIVAQYWFEEVQGETDMGAIAASIIGETGVQVQAFIADELAYVLDGTDLYIVWTGNQNDPLQATYNLLQKVDPNRRIGGGQIAGDKGFTRAAETLTSYRKYLNSADNQVPLGMRIDELRGLGELRDKIKQSRSLFGKFFDLFNADDIKMNFVVTKWGPAFVRKMMLGTRGGSDVQGGLSPADVKAFEDTGLFREQTLKTMVENTEYVAKATLVSDFIIKPEEDTTVSLNYVGGLTGFNVIGIESLNIAKNPKFPLDFGESFADAYFLYFPPGRGNKIIELKSAPPAETQAPAESKPEKDPWQDYNKDVEELVGGGFKPLGDGYYTYPFNKSNEPIDESSGDYLATIVASLTTLTGKIPKDAPAPNDVKKFSIYIIGTADPVGEIDPNKTLSNDRVKNFFTKFSNFNSMKPILKSLKVADKDDTSKLAKLTSLPLGEEPWAEKDSVWSNKNKYSNDARKPLRIAKVFVGPFDATDEQAKSAISKLLMDKAKTLPGLKESVDLDPLRRQIRKILLETMRR